MKQIILLTVNVEKIEKRRLYKDRNGTYVTLIGVMDSDPDKYGKNGFVIQGKDKNENIKMPIIGQIEFVGNSKKAPGSSAPSIDDLPF